MCCDCGGKAGFDGDGGNILTEKTPLSMGKATHHAQLDQFVKDLRIN